MPIEWSAVKVATRLITSVTVLASLGAGGPVWGQSQFSFAPRPIARAVDIYVTPRGQKLFQTDLEKLLLINGLSLREGLFDSFQYKASEPIRLDALPMPVEKFKSTLGQLRDTIKQWLIGFELADPVPQIDIKDVHYVADFQTFALRVRGDGVSPTTGRSGIVADLELVIPEIDLKVASVRGTDLANDYLGSFGIEGLWARSLRQGTPLKIQMSFLMEVTPAGGVKVEALGIETNLDKVAIDLGFDRLVFPEIVISINGRSMKLNPAPIRKFILEQKPALVGALQSYLTSFLRERVPQIITEAAAQALPVQAKEVNRMDPPGAPGPLPLEKKFVWALQPFAARMAGDSLGLQLSAFAEDPLRASSPQFLGNPNIVGQPLLDALPKDAYDVALVVNPSFVNRLLQLSFDRRYFDKVAVGKDQTIRLSEVPRISVNARSPDGSARVRTSIDFATGGWKNLIAKDKLQLTFELIVRFSRDPKTGKDRLVIAKIDTDTLIVDTSNVSVPILNGAVESFVRKELAKINADLAKKENVLAEIPLPDQILGIKIRAKKITTESKTGFLAVYIEYVK